MASCYTPSKTCGRMGEHRHLSGAVRVFGKKCHANEAGPGSDCINALDAAVAAHLSVNQVKQYLDANIYGILNSGGTCPTSSRLCQPALLHPL